MQQMLSERQQRDREIFSQIENWLAQNDDWSLRPFSQLQNLANTEKLEVVGDMEGLIHIYGLHLSPSDTVQDVVDTLRNAVSRAAEE